MRPGYVSWLEQTDVIDTTVAVYVAGIKRIEQHYGDVETAFKQDKLKALLAVLSYSTADQRRNKPNPSRIPIYGNVRIGLATYRSHLYHYVRFLNETIGGQSPILEPTSKRQEQSRLDQSWLRPRPARQTRKIKLGPHDVARAWFSRHALTLDECVRVEIPMKNVSEASAFARNLIEHRHALSAQITKAFFLEQNSNGEVATSGSLLTIKAPARQITAILDLVRERHPQAFEKVAVIPLAVPWTEREPLSS